MFGNLYVVDLLLKDGRADPNGERGFGIKYAIQNDRVRVVARLLEDPRTIIDPDWIKLAKSNDMKQLLART